MAPRRHERGQVTVEMAVLFGFAVAGMVAMSIYLQRAVQGGMKSNADSLGTQFSIKDPWMTVSRSSTRDTKSDLASGQYTKACQTMNKTGVAVNVDCKPDPGVASERINKAAVIAYPSLIAGQGGRPTTNPFELPATVQD